MKRKLLAALLAFVMVFSLLPVAAFAADEAAPSIAVFSFKEKAADAQSAINTALGDKTVNDVADQTMYVVLDQRVTEEYTVVVTTESWSGTQTVYTEHIEDGFKAVYFTFDQSNPSPHANSTISSAKYTVSIYSGNATEGDAVATADLYISMVYFNLNGGSFADGRSSMVYLAGGDTLDFSDYVPTSDTSRFVGWTTTYNGATADAESYTAPTEFSYAITHSVYAVWERTAPYTLTFQMGTSWQSDTSVTVSSGKDGDFTKYTIPENNEISGTQFGTDGYWKGISGNYDTYLPGDTIEGIDSDNWTFGWVDASSMVNITFTDPTGTNQDHVEKVEGNTYYNFVTPTDSDSGYGWEVPASSDGFDYWALASDESNSKVYGYYAEADATYKAVWKEKTPDVDVNVTAFGYAETAEKATEVINAALSDTYDGTIAGTDVLYVVLDIPLPVGHKVVLDGMNGYGYPGDFITDNTAGTQVFWVAKGADDYNHAYYTGVTPGAFTATVSQVNTDKTVTTVTGYLSQVTLDLNGGEIDGSDENVSKMLFGSAFGYEEWELTEEALGLSKEGNVLTGWETESSHYSNFKYTTSTDSYETVTLTAQWATPTYHTVTFALGYEDAPEAPAAIQVLEGSSAGDRWPADPQREGYRFAGWKDEDGNVYTSSTVIAGDVTVTAQWVDITTPREDPTITTTVSAAELADLSGNYPDGAGVDLSVSSEGKNADAYDRYTEVTVSGAVKLHQHVSGVWNWTWGATFTAGSEVSNVVYAIADTQAGLDSARVYENDEYANTTYSDGVLSVFTNGNSTNAEGFWIRVYWDTTVTDGAVESTALYADYQVVFNIDLLGVTYTYKAPADAPEGFTGEDATVRVDYATLKAAVLDGGQYRYIPQLPEGWVVPETYEYHWEVNGETVTMLDSTNGYVDQEITIVLTEKPEEYSVTFKPGDLGELGGSGEEKTFTKETNREVPQAPAQDDINLQYVTMDWHLGWTIPDDYGFDYWTTPDGEKYTGTRNNTIYFSELTEDLVLTAHWYSTENSVDVTLDDLRGTTTTVHHTSGETFSFPETAPVSGDAHDKFAGWYLSTDAAEEPTLYQPGDEYGVVDSAVTFYAKWTTVYVVTFDLNYEGAPAATTVQYEEGEVIAEPEKPTREGYTFDGWFNAAQGGEQQEFVSGRSPEATGDVTYYAHWTEKKSETGGNTGGTTKPGGSTGGTTGGSTGGNTTEPTEPNKSVPKFVDVAEDSWYSEAVDFMAELGLMTGIGNDKFDPEGTTTRGMIATILYRLAEEPDADVSSFSDVLSGLWYSEAVAWADAEGVVTGYGDGTFRPDEAITREQLATMLWRYAGKSEASAESLADFPDAGNVSGYAETAMAWAVEKGIINGADGKLLPGGNATRAQVAAMFQRFCTNVLGA